MEVHTFLLKDLGITKLQTTIQEETKLELELYESIIHCLPTDLNI